MSKRLTIMYRADISKERVRELIGADDASILTWDDVFAERGVLTQRCRELELWQEDARDHMTIIERENDEMRDELKRLQSAVLQAATASAELAKYLRAEQTLDELATACKDLAPWKNIMAAQGAGKKPRAKK